MFLAHSSFSDEFETVRELRTLRCCFGPHLCFGLIRGKLGSRRIYARFFLDRRPPFPPFVPSASAILNCIMSNPFHQSRDSDGREKSILQHTRIHCITFDAAAEIESPNHLARLPKTVGAARHTCFRTTENSSLHCCWAIRSTSFFSRLIPTRVPLVTRGSGALPIPIT